MQVGKVGIMGQPPVVVVRPLSDLEEELALWCEKMATKNENHHGKYLTIAAKLRELQRLRPYVRHTKSCPIEKFGGKSNAEYLGKGCDCGLTE